MKWLEYTDFVDFEDEIGHSKKAACYPSLQEAVDKSDRVSGECSVVKAEGYYAVVYPIPTSYTTTIEKLKTGQELKPFEIWDGELLD